MELSWILDYRAEVESDFSVFHRIDDPYALPASKFFPMAEMLVYYDGAVRAVLIAEFQKQNGTTPLPVGESSGEIKNLSGSAIAALADGEWNG